MSLHAVPSSASTNATSPSLTLHELGDASAIVVSPLPSLSPFCLKVHLALGALELSFTRAHGPHPGHWKPLNSVGQVPVMRIGGDVVADSTAIVRRLLEVAAPEVRARWTRTAADDAEAFLWEELADSELNGFVVAARWLDDDNWPQVQRAYFAEMPPPVRAILPRVLRRKQVQSMVAREHWRRGAVGCWQRYERLLDTLEARAPAEGFWLGELSFADIALVAQLRSLMTPLTPSQSAAITRRVRLHTWIDRVLVACGQPATGAVPTIDTARMRSAS